MSKQSSENYLDQLLNSMNVKTKRSKDKQVQALEKEIESVKQTLKSRDEDSFYDELESELENDEYRRFVSDFESELEEYEEKKKVKEPEPIKETLLEEPELIEEIPEEFESLEEIALEELEPMKEEILEEPKELLSEEELETLSLEDLVLDEIKEEDIQVQEPVVQDLSGLSEEELDKLLAEDGDFEDIENMLSNGQLESLEGATDFEAFAQNEMTGAIEIGEGDDLDELIPDVSKKKESFIDKIKKLFSKKGKGDDKVNIASGGTDVNALADENQQILEAFEKAEGKGKKKKEKPKKEKKKKEKPKKEKKPKAPKQPKPKKEKKEKKPKEVDPTPPLPKKPVILIWLLVISMLGLVIILTNLVSYSTSVKDAKKLFEKGDYSAAFGEIEGLEIKEKDLELYNQLSTLAPIDSEWDAYIIFAFYDKKVEALDSLICAAGRCEVNRENAILCSSEEELDTLIEKITKELKEKYGITYEEAIDVYNSFDREEYSIRMNTILENLGLLVEE